MKPLRYPAPARMSVQTGNKMITDRCVRLHEVTPGNYEVVFEEVRRAIPIFTTVPWDFHGVLKHVAAGGWFGPGTEFDSRRTAAAATSATALFSLEMEV